MKKLSIVLLVGLILLVAGCSGTSTEALQLEIYEKETAQMKKVKEHQVLQLEILQINAAINQFSTPASAVPVTPAQ